MSSLPSYVSRYKRVFSGEFSPAMPGASSSNAYMSALNAINWSRSYKWKVTLDDVPPPFDRGGIIGLPVIDVTDPIGYGNTYDMEHSVSWLRVPRDRGRYEIVMNLFDDDNATVETFFENWFNDIYDVTNGVACVTQAVKQIDITRLNSQDQVVVSRSYLVYPYQPLRGYNKQDDSGPRRYDITFIVVSNCLKENEFGQITHNNEVITTSSETLTGNYSGLEFLPELAQ